MKVRLVDSSSITPPPPQQTAKAKATMEILSALFAENGSKVAVIEPDAGESIRGLKTSISRQAKNMDKPVRVWDQDNVVYVAVPTENGSSGKKRGRPRAAAAAG